MAVGSSIDFPAKKVWVSFVCCSTGERVSSLKEGLRYEYRIEGVGYSLKPISGVLAHSQMPHDCEQGWVEPGNYVGLLELVLCDGAGVAIDKACVEVCSAKLDYQTEYRSMLEDIASRCADFLLQLESPVDQQFRPEDTGHEPTLAQRLYFIKNLLGGEDFQQALQRVVAMPNTRWREESRIIDMRQGRRIDRHTIRQFASARRRVALPEGHPLLDRMKTIPERMEIHDKRDTVDTAENRFVKHALSQFQDMLDRMLARFKELVAATYPGLVAEVQDLAGSLEETLSDDFFREISPPTILPLNSPVLQRKDGYRQILRAWMLFELAARLSWAGGDDVYAGGKRDAAALYEYWVFFRLLDLVADLFKLKTKPVEELIDDKDFVLKLKAGRHLPIHGVYEGAGRKLNIQFSYNRTFGFADYPDSGSWSRQMRPDYTLSLWPDGFSPEEAEKQELITHVHFDAKYKVDDLVQLFGKKDNDLTEEDLKEEKDDQWTGTFKRGDLLKMHAYRDAIRRSAGAYVIYPGTETGRFKGFHELLPGLGAFPLRPGKSDDGSAALARFLKEVVAHVCDRATQREQQTYHMYRIHKRPPSSEVRDALPELEDAYRAKPPAELFVLHGWHDGEKNLKWVEREKIYNFRTETDRGSLRLHPSVAGASYLLLHGEGEFRKADRLYRIVSEGPRVFSRETLIKEGYPGKGSQPYYLVYDISPLDKDDPLNGYEWDLSQVDGIMDGRGSPISGKGIPLSVLMKAATLKKKA